MMPRAHERRGDEDEARPTAADVRTTRTGNNYKDHAMDPWHD